MTITTTQKHLLTALAFAALVLVVGLGFTVKKAEGSTIALAVPKVATSSLMSVGPGNATSVLPASSNCVDRVISTFSQPVTISFTSSVVPSSTSGHIQNASTTVAYNNGDYGCGAISVYGYAASTSIMVTSLTQ